ncbi:MAG TPA: hypothetical protein VF899_00380 [Pyrinomonadaceae bacterium]
MFIGHFAVGFAAKRYAPETSLGTLIAAAALLDLLWPVFLLLGWEQVRIDPGNTAFTPLDFVSYPLSHSLVGAICWATIFALLYYFFIHYQRGAVMIWIGVVSHWVLDFMVHRPDLPLYPEGARLGLGLWNSILATVIVEGLMYVAGIWIYLRVTRAKDGIGRWGSWSFIVVVAALYVVNIFSPPLPNERLLAMVAIPYIWLLILWAWWADRHREAR